jgi:ribonuclease PH
MVLCTASLEDRVPDHRVGRGGWLTAEYQMAPGSTGRRSARESARGRVQGRTQEIQRLIGRSLRAALPLNHLPEVTLTIDCEVLQADGGTRTASITGGWVALALAVETLRAQGRWTAPTRLRGISAVSAGVVDGEPRVDLPYAEDVRADVDGNFVRADCGGWIEVQATAEDGVLPRYHLDALLALSGGALDHIWALQQQALGPAWCARWLTGDAG